MLPFRIGLLVELLVVAAPLRAEQPVATGVRLAFVRTQAASECISANALEREITRRMGHNPFDGDARQWIEGTIDKQGNTFEVQLFERDADGNTLGSRRLREQAIDCHKLDDALELTIALIIDPSAQLAAFAPPQVPALPPASPVVTAPATTPKFEQPMNSGTYRGIYADRPNLTVIPTTPAISRLGTAFVSADALALHGVLPGVSLGAELATRVALDDSDRTELRVSGWYLPEKVVNNQGKLGYSLTSLEVGACLQERAHQWAAFGCGGLGIGGVHVIVYDPDPRKPDDRLWSSLRVEGGGAVRIVGPLWVEARVFDLIPLQRWQFRVINVTDGVPTPVQAYRQSWFMPGAALGLGLHFG